MKSNFINTDEYPEADRQYKDRLFRFVFQKPEDLPFPQTCGLLQRDSGRTGQEVLRLSDLYEIVPGDSHPSWSVRR